jgi:hypothetical protein
LTTTLAQTPHPKKPKKKKQSLRAVADAVAPYGADALFYLAAAVSDFYVPWSRLAEHKIQSGGRDDSKKGGGAAFTLRLARVPKCLGTLREQWAPRAAVVSFKLETDEKILMDKAGGALDKYKVHAVVANLLHTRKDRVWVVRRKEGEEVAGGGEGAGGGKAASSSLDVAVIDRPPEMVFIEDALVANVVALHDRLRAEAAAAAEKGQA